MLIGAQSAYEIKKVHNKEPPPKKILENLTAKGGDLLSRTVETFKWPSNRESYGQESDASSGDEVKTPKDDKMDIDDAGSGSGRTTRGLRQAPPPRVLFQPDTSSARQTRHGSANQQSPQPSSSSNGNYNTYNATSNPPHHSGSLANYEPRPQMPLILRPVVTPGSNSAQFDAERKREREARLTQKGINFIKTKDGIMKPGAGFEGPNIYVRTLQGLRSGIVEEENYALHHLVKISHERGDKYKFEAFPNLAEGLIDYALRISSLFYDIRWEISYTNDVHDINTLDGIDGTPDLLQRIRYLDRLGSFDGLETWEEEQILTKCNEAALTIRNLSILEENAIYLSSKPQAKDFLVIALNLPSDPRVTELKHYALDICEQLIRYWVLDMEDPLYQSLLNQIEEGLDRGAIIASIRALCRAAMQLEDPNHLQGIENSMLRQLSDYLLLQDDELAQAALEFFYIYTANVDNVAKLLFKATDINLPAICNRATELLQHHASEQHTKQMTERSQASAEAKTIPKVPDDLMREFLRMKEPERSNQWLRSVFEEKSDGEITQIALWQAYQSLFTEHATAQEPLLPAADFIKNVSTIFTNANAQIVQGPPQKFVIKGIRPRHGPLDMHGRTYMRCLWRKPNSTTSAKEDPCGHFVQKPHQLYEHIAKQHLGIPSKDDGTWDLEAASKKSFDHSDCFWSECRHFAWKKKASPSPYQLAMHIKTHLGDSSKKALIRQYNNRTPATQTSKPTGSVTDLDEEGRRAAYLELRWTDTLTDEQHNPIGIPLMSLLLLRNVARNIPRAAARITYENVTAPDIEEEGSRQLKNIFMPLWGRLSHIATYNRIMTRHVYGVLSIIQKGIIA